MLGRDCLRAVFRKQFPPPLNWVKSGFSWKSRNGFKVGAKVGFWPIFTHFCTQKTYFWPTFRPIPAHWQKPILNPLSVEINCSPKKGPEAARTQHNPRCTIDWAFGGKRWSLSRERAERDKMRIHHTVAELRTRWRYQNKVAVYTHCPLLEFRRVFKRSACGL